MKVVKFGGSSVASAAQVRKVGAIVVADPERRIVIVSAPGKRTSKDQKVTDLLIQLARTAIANGDVEAALSTVIDRFGSITRVLKLDPALLVDLDSDLRKRLGTRTEHTATGDAPFFDLIKAAGEDHCARIVAAHLRQLGEEAHYVNPGEAGLLLSDEPGNARVLTSSYGRLRALRDMDGVVVLPGFFGHTETGRVVTFPRGGSDISGAILAAAVDADVYENFTDVDAVCVSDPRIVRNPKSVEEITYREMRELAYAGSAVFHDEALEPVFHAGIPVNVRNTNNPSAPGTMILPTRDARANPVAGIAGTGGFCSLFVAKYLMNREIGFGRRLLRILEDEEVPFEHMPTGIDNMSVIIREAQFPAATRERVLRRIRNELDVDEANIEPGLALVMVVGEGMRHVIGIAGRACSALAKGKVNLEMINQGSSEISMMFGIKQNAVNEAVRALYREFFPTRKTRPSTRRKGRQPARAPKQAAAG